MRDQEPANLVCDQSLALSETVSSSVQCRQHHSPRAVRIHSANWAGGRLNSEVEHHLGTGTLGTCSRILGHRKRRQTPASSANWGASTPFFKNQRKTGLE